MYLCIFVDEFYLFIISGFLMRHLSFSGAKAVRHRNHEFSSCAGDDKSRSLSP